MNFILVLAFVVGGELDLITVPVPDTDACSRIVQEFVDLAPDAPFQARCISVVDTLGLNRGRRS